jgi:hypothetical protein
MKAIQPSVVRTLPLIETCTENNADLCFFVNLCSSLDENILHLTFVENITAGT